MEVAVTEGMVKEQVFLLGGSCWDTYNVDEADMFSISTGNGVKGRKFTYTKSGDKNREAIDTGITVCGVTGVKFICVSDPAESRDLIDFV